MSRFALVTDVGKVVNVIEADPPTDAELVAAEALDDEEERAAVLRRRYVAPDGLRLIADPDAEAHIGSTHSDATGFVAPVEA